MNTPRSILLSSIAAALCACAPSASAALIAYSVDANTTQLWHLDEAAGGSVTAGLGSLSGNAYSVDLNPAAGATVTSVLGAAAFSGFGNAANISAVDFGLGFDFNASGAFEGDVSGTALSADRINLSSLGINGTQPFTLEAMISPASAAGNREIISTDSSSGTRGFQFRLTTGGTTGQRLEFNLISSAGAQRFAEIPNTGANAFALNSWFHTAFVFDGTNAQFFWTKVDTATTVANAVGALQALTISGTAGSIEGPLVFGNENRNVAGESLFGLIDEIRLSNVARTETGFIFTVPEPGGAALLLSGIATVLCLRRRFLTQSPSDSR